MHHFYGHIYKVDIFTGCASDFSITLQNHVSTIKHAFTYWELLECFKNLTKKNCGLQNG